MKSCTSVIIQLSEEHFCKSNTEYSLLVFLDRARDLSFTNAEDRIFAFATVAQDLECPVLVRPDYSISIPEIFHQFAADYIRATTDSELLGYVYHDT